MKLNAAFASSPNLADIYPRMRWPKPRAAIALDIGLMGEVKDAPRVDAICKWLLDELSGHLYRDDRQVKLLFAHAKRRDVEVESVNLGLARASNTAAKNASCQPADDWISTSLHTASAEPFTLFDESRGLSPQLFIHARTRASVLATLRAETQLPPEWGPIDDDDDYRYWNPYVREYFGGRRRLVDYRDRLRTSTSTDLDELTRAERELNYHDQAWEQRVVDSVFSSLVTFMPAHKFLGWGILRERMKAAPYVFDLGVLPNVGGSEEFRKRFREMLVDRSHQFPDLFPLRASSGISMVMFEDDQHSKDLDNLIRTLLPDILDVLRPPRTDMPGWIASAPDIDSAHPDIPFLEVAALSAEDAHMPPGTVIFGLSGGHRYESWWSKAERRIDERLDRLAENDEYS